MVDMCWIPLKGSLAYLVCHLDAVLSGKGWDDAVAAAKNQWRILDDPLRFAAGIDYFLSAENRVMLCWIGSPMKDEGHLMVNADAPEEVLSRWKSPMAKKLVEEIEKSVWEGVPRQAGK